MTAVTARELEAAAIAKAGADPTIARLIQAGDPRVLAQLRSQATMLAMVSAQVENARYEAFLKSRDATILADATLKGILPLGRSCAVSLTVTNGDAAPFTLAAGRRLLDPKGRIFMVDADVIVPAGGTATATAKQKTIRTVEHTVTLPTPYYRMEVTGADTDTFVTSLEVWKDGLIFTYSPDWFNVDPGDFCYQAETDERRRLMVCMGSDAIGYAVQAGDEFSLVVTECEGKITDLQAGDAFTLEYVFTTPDGKQQIALSAVNDTGAAPHTVAELRVMAQYPSIYDHNAVYLGEFAFLLRRYISDVTFLSVWNEQIEESARGASVNNINKLFVAGRINGMDDATFQARAKELIARADDSYKVAFVTVVDKPATVVVTGSVSVVHDKTVVAQQIRGAILDAYGAGSPLVSMGMSNPLKVQAITKLLKDNIAAFQDGLSDFSVTVTIAGTPMPEDFVQVTDASLTVTLTSAASNNGLWNQ